MELLDNERGGYRFLTGIAPYSSGVVAMDGHEIVHVTLQRPVAYRRGFEIIDRHLADHDRPRHALCAIALRSPKPLSLDGFTEFNRGYRTILAEWDLLIDGHNPVARTNVAPAVHAPDETVLYGFAYTVAGDVSPTFVVAGAGDVVTQALTKRAIVREGETTAEAMAEKAAHVMAAMRQRVDGLRVRWSDVTRVNLYTVHAVRPYLSEVILAPLAETSVHGVHWHYARPPIVGLEFEMDLRGVRCERWLDR
jgi:hypothetical protein